MKIKIIKKSLMDFHIIYMNDKRHNHLFVDAKKSKYPVERFKFKVNDMVIGWPEQLLQDNVVDGLIYKISIKQHKEEKKYLFSNKFPEDIYRLENLIQEVVGELNNE